MKLGRRAWLVCLFVGLIPAGQADDAKTPPKAVAPKAPPAKVAAVPEADDELLEFLGGVDSETGDQDWLDYLSRTDIGKVAARARRRAALATEVNKDD